jgi:hypothetical protein
MESTMKTVPKKGKLRVPAKSLPHIKVADEVWLATALLHRENPSRGDFTPKEIEARVAREAITEETRPGIYVHAVQHCVANRPPNPGCYRMLYETRPGYRRLFRKGDPYDPRREGGKTIPEADEIPLRYADLLRWYDRWSQLESVKASESDPLLALYGSGKKLWAEEHADDYVSRLREGWN